MNVLTKSLCAFSFFLVMHPAAPADDDLHRGFDRVLKEHVKAGHVDYPGIKNDGRFHEYLQVLAETDPGALQTAAQQLAFWINAYNALAIQGVLEGLSPGTFFGRIGYFKTTDYKVGGETISLYDLERDIIIPFGDPRVHFAIVCASKSCPKLRSEAYTGHRLDEQLDENAREFLNDSNKNNYDAERRRANVSKIFRWFKQEFKDHSGSVTKYIAQFIDDGSLAKAMSTEKFEIRYLKYDWSLNGTALVRAGQHHG